MRIKKFLDQMELLDSSVSKAGKVAGDGASELIVVQVEVAKTDHIVFPVRRKWACKVVVAQVKMEEVAHAPVGRQVTSELVVA